MRIKAVVHAPCDPDLAKALLRTPRVIPFSEPEFFSCQYNFLSEINYVETQPFIP